MQQNKEEVKAWKKQLVIRSLVKTDKEEALHLFYRSHTQSNIVYQALEPNEQEYKSMEKQGFEKDYIYENSFALVDPSNNGKIIMLFITKDMSKIVITPPNKDEITCPKEYIKLKLYYDTWKPLENAKFAKGECETTSTCTDPDYQGLGLATMVYSKYLEDAYMRGVKHIYDIYYNLVSYRMVAKYQCFNSQILNKISLDNYKLNGRNIFDNFEHDGGMLVSKDVTDDSVQEVGLGHLIKKKQQLQVQQMEQQNNDQLPKEITEDQSQLSQQSLNLSPKM